MFRNLNTDFTSFNWLVGSVELIKNAEPDNYNCSSYSIRFDCRSEFSFRDGSMGKNVIIFRADMIWSVHIDNKNKDILISVERPTQGLDDITLTAEWKHPINFTQAVKDLYYV